MSGLTAFEIGSLVVSAVGTGVGIEARERAEGIQSRQIQAEMRQTQLSKVERSNKRAKKLSQTLSSAAAQEASRNVSLASPTFKSIQEQSYRNFKDDENSDAMNVMFRQSTLRQQMNQNRLSADVDIGKSISNLGSFFVDNLDKARLANRDEPKAKTRTGSNEGLGERIQEFGEI